MNSGVAPSFILMLMLAEFFISVLTICTLHPDVVQLLLNYNADPTLKTQDGLTALRIATVKGHDEVVSILMKH